VDDGSLLRQHDHLVALVVHPGRPRAWLVVCAGGDGAIWTRPA